MEEREKNASVEPGVGKESLLIFLVLALNAIVIWFKVDTLSRWWYVVLGVDVVCAGWMAFNIICALRDWIKQKLAGHEGHKVKRNHYRRMAM